MTFQEMIVFSVFKQKYHPPGHVTYVDVSHVTELRMIDRQDAGLRVGCAVTLIELQEYTDKMVNTLPGEKAQNIDDLALLRPYIYVLRF